MHSNSLSVARALRARLDAITIALALFSVCLQPALHAAVTLADFGYQNMKVNGVLAAGPGPRPLVVILVNFAGYPRITNSPSFFADLIFNASRYPSFNGYFQAVSNGRFSYSNAGVIGPLNLSAAETEINWAGNDTLYCSNIIYKAMISSPTSFGNYDANHDGHVTRDELAILIISQDNLWGGRYVGSVKPAGFAFDCGGANGGLVSVVSSPTQPNQNGSLIPFATLLEETEEMLGIIDIYGYDAYCLSPGLSPQSCNYSPTNIYYLDPFNRLQMGWCEPRIRSLTAGGIETIPAAQVGASDAPIILYDPARGTSEFFILEYRTQTSHVGSGYDANVATNGLAVWHVELDANHNVALVPTLNPTNVEPAVWNEGPPTFQRGTSTLWGSDATSPVMNWLNGATLTHLHVRFFNVGDGSITVEWLSAEDTWVDFAYPGFPFFPEVGVFDRPFNTLAEGVAGVSYGGILHLKTGTSAERMTIDKPMTLTGYNGPVTIGQ